MNEKKSERFQELLATLHAANNRLDWRKEQERAAELVNEPAEEAACNANDEAWKLLDPGHPIAVAYFRAGQLCERADLTQERLDQCRREVYYAEEALDEANRKINEFSDAMAAERKAEATA